MWLWKVTPAARRRSGVDAKTFLSRAISLLHFFFFSQDIFVRTGLFSSFRLFFAAR
ncbi:hypothetical protein CSUI_009451, partial [Cystoisospora suis]